MKIVLGRIHVMLIDNIKTTSYEPWYNTSFDLSEGLWIGSGISNQFTLRVITSARELDDEIEPSFGYIVEKGKATQVKLIVDE